VRKLLLILVTLSALQSSAQYRADYWRAQQRLSLLSEDKGLTRPQKATLYSAILPGSGQIYNKKYWKAGVVYAGAAGLVYMYKMNNDSMRSYQNAYALRLDDDTSTVDEKYWFLSDAAVKSYRDYHRRLKDFAILGSVALYALQIIDANVDAHLHEFKINKDLSLSVYPEIRPAYNSMFNTGGLKVSLKF